MGLLAQADHACSSKNELWILLHGPVELAQQGLVEELLNRGLVALAPRNSDAGVHVVDLGGAEGHSAQVLFDMHLQSGMGSRRQVRHRIFT